jgi:hypothetical protein
LGAGRRAVGCAGFGLFCRRLSWVSFERGDFLGGKGKVIKIIIGFDRDVAEESGMRDEGDIKE